MASTRQRENRYIGLYRDAAGKQKSAGTYDTAEEALARATVAELDARPQAPEEVYAETTRGKITVAAYGPRWLEDHRLEETSRETYESLMQRIIKALGAFAVADLDTARCKKFFRKIERELSPASVGHVRTVLRGMCHAAVEAGILDKVPEMEIAPVHSKERMIATREQARHVQMAVGGAYAVLVDLMFASGCRWSEIAGLGPEHVVLHADRAVLKVGRRVLVEVHGRPLEKRYGKSAKAYRDIAIPLDLGQRLAANARGGHLIRAPRGGYLSRSNFRRVWRDACADAGVPGLRLHDARHSHISWLANDPRIPLAAVRDRAGHSSLSVTSRYVHSDDHTDGILSALAA